MNNNWFFMWVVIFAIFSCYFGYIERNIILSGFMGFGCFYFMGHSHARMKFKDGIKHEKEKS